MSAYVFFGGAGLMVGVWVGRVFDWWVWWLVVAEWGLVGQFVAHSAPEILQSVAVAFELSIAVVNSSSACLEIGFPQARTQRVSQPLGFVGHVSVNFGTGNLGLVGLSCSNHSVATSTLPRIVRA